MSWMSLTWGELDHMQPTGWRLPLPPTCGRCGYNLTGLTSTRCPECGLTIDWKEVYRRAFRVYYLVRRLKYAHRDTNAALLLSLLGWVLLGSGTMSSSIWVLAMVRLGSFSMALLAAVLGAQVLNLWRVPAWARNYLTGPFPDIRLGTLALVLALSLLLSSCLF
jgi:hypothetical protein